MSADPFQGQQLSCNWPWPSCLPQLPQARRAGLLAGKSCRHQMTWTCRARCGHMPYKSGEWQVPTELHALQRSQRLWSSEASVVACCRRCSNQHRRTCTKHDILRQAGSGKLKCRFMCLTALPARHKPLTPSADAGGDWFHGPRRIWTGFTDCQGMPCIEVSMGCQLASAASQTAYHAD